MRNMKMSSAKRGRSIMLFVALWVCMSIPGCSLFDRTTTVYGRVTEVAGAGVDSIVIAFVVSKSFGPSMGLTTAITDKDGQYQGVFDVPRGWGNLDVVISEGTNPAYHKTYKSYEVYLDGKRVKDCCPARIGHKTNYDFRVYK